MKATLVIALLALGGFATDARAFEAADVRITQLDSFNFAGHLWVKISANNTCSIPSPYFIVQRWDNVTEPQTTDRKLMYQLALTAFIAGKKIRVIGATCYLNQYLFADQIMVSE